MRSGERRELRDCESPAVNFPEPWTAIALGPSRIPVVSNQLALAGLQFVPQRAVIQGATVEMAFVLGDSELTEPTDEMWNPATWAPTVLLGGQTTWVAQCLVGPDGVVLVADTYVRWVKVSGNSISPEAPEIPVPGLLEVF